MQATTTIEVAADRPPMNTRAEQGLDLLRELDASASSGSTEGRDCDRVIAMLRARLSAR